MSEQSKKGLIGMILSAVSVCLGWYFSAGFVGMIFAIAGVVLAIVAMNMLKPIKGMTENPGRVFVKIGSILSLIGLILCAVSACASLGCGIFYCVAGR